MAKAAFGGLGAHVEKVKTENAAMQARLKAKRQRTDGDTGAPVASAPPAENNTRALGAAGSGGPHVLDGPVASDARGGSAPGVSNDKYTRNTVADEFLRKARADCKIGKA